VPEFTATTGTSVLVSLQSAELLGAISVLFNRILVPSKVREELREGGEKNQAAIAAINNLALFEHCDQYDRQLVKLLLDTRKHLKQGRDEGEAEAVIQATQQSASMVLSDDPLGREWAKGHALDCHGAIWICHELRRTGYLKELRPYYVRMITHGRRQPLPEMNTFLQDFGEPPITQEEYREYTSRLQ
jgi:predicted nucleic acid-binding protein